MGMIVNPSMFAAWVRAPNRLESYLVTGAESINVQMDKWQVGRASITTHPSAAWVQAIINHPVYTLPWYDWTLDIYWRDMTTPVWSGPVSGPRRTTHQGTVASAKMTVGFESMWSNVWRRRKCQAPSNTRYPPILGITANKSTVKTMHDCIGHSTLLGGWYLPALTYDGYTRNNFGPNWTITVMADPATDEAAGRVWTDFQSGANARQVLLTYAEQADIDYYMTEQSPAAWEAGTIWPYEREDVSGSVILTPSRGSLRSAEYEEDPGTTVTAWHVTGAGEGASQYRIWSTDPVAVAAIGLWEDGVPLPGNTDATAMDGFGTAKLLLSARADYDRRFGIVPIEQPGHQFNVDYRVGSKVSYSDTIVGEAGAEVVTGWQLDVRGNEADLQIKFGQPVRSMTKALAKFIPPVEGGGMTAGGVYYPKGG